MTLATEGRPDGSCPDWVAELDLFAPPYLDDPARFHERLRREAPVCFSPKLGMWLVSRHEDICSVLRQPQRFSSAEAAQGGTALTDEAKAILAQGHPFVSTPFDSDPPHHERLRQLMGSAFTRARITQQVPRIRRVARALANSIADEGEADLVERFAYPLPALVILEMTGFPVEDLATVKRWSGALFAFLFSKVPPEQQVDMARSIVDYQRYCESLIEERRRDPQDDIISDLVRATWQGTSLTMPELVQMVSGSFIGAGHETTTQMIAKVVRLLLSDPARWKAVEQDRSLIPATLEEAMRLDPVTHGMVRTLREDTVLAGVHIPKGARLLLLYFSANHDVARFAESSRFDIRRDTRQALTFGRGIHYCVGAALARTEGRIALETLVDRLPSLRLAPGKPFEHVLNTTIHGLKHLWVEWDPGLASEWREQDVPVSASIIDPVMDPVMDPVIDPMSAVNELPELELTQEA